MTKLPSLVEAMIVVAKKTIHDPNTNTLRSILADEEIDCFDSLTQDDVIYNNIIVDYAFRDGELKEVGLTVFEVDKYLTPVEIKEYCKP